MKIDVKCIIKPRIRETNHKPIKINLNKYLYYKIAILYYIRMRGDSVGMKIQNLIVFKFVLTYYYTVIVKKMLITDVWKAIEKFVLKKDRERDSCIQ